MHARLHAHPMHSLHQPQVSAALPLLQGAVGFPLPPLLAAGMQAVGTLPVALTNGRTCSSDMMQHPAAAPHLRALYRWLEPAVAPLEPLLLGAGVGRAHPHRHCHCGELLLWLWLPACLPACLPAFVQIGAGSAPVRCQFSASLLQKALSD